MGLSPTTAHGSGGALPPGGDKGTVLTKATSTDGDAFWYPGFVAVTIRHSADFANLRGSAPVVATTASTAGAALTLPPSLFGNNSIIDVRLANDESPAVSVGGSLVVQSADGTVWIEQDTPSNQIVPAATTESIDFATNAGGAGAGLSWNAVTKQVDIASAGVYSAFVTLNVTPA